MDRANNESYCRERVYLLRKYEPVKLDIWAGARKRKQNDTHT